MQLNDKTKKIFDISLRVLTALIVAFTVFMMVFTIFTVTTVDKNDRSILGVRFYIVQTDSMSKSENNKDMDVHFNAGDIVLIKNVDDPTALSEGDIIAFLSTNTDNYGETITHMIKTVRKENGVTIGYDTYGTNTGTVDEKMVKPEYVIGEYAGKLPWLGHFFAFTKSNMGYVVCILVPFLLLILYNVLNVIRLSRQYKREQNAEIEAERAAIAEERAQNAEILKELQELKAQLAHRESEEPKPDAKE